VPQVGAEVTANIIALAEFALASQNALSPITDLSETALNSAAAAMIAIRVEIAADPAAIVEATLTS